MKSWIPPQKTGYSKAGKDGRCPSFQALKARAGQLPSILNPWSDGEAHDKRTQIPANLNENFARSPNVTAKALQRRSTPPLLHNLRVHQMDLTKMLLADDPRPWVLMAGEREPPGQSPGGPLQKVRFSKFSRYLPASFFSYLPALTK